MSYDFPHDVTNIDHDEENNLGYYVSASCEYKGLFVRTGLHTKFRYEEKSPRVVSASTSVISCGASYCF